MKVEESLNVTFDETPPPSKTSHLEDDDLVEEEAIEVSKIRPLGNNFEDKPLENNEIINIKESKNHLLENIIVPNPMDATIIGTKWVFRNKLDENGVVSRNKARLVAQDFKLFQMDVKSAFLNGFINEEVYMALPPGFINFAKPNHVYRLKKALYGLKQAPKAWFDRLKAFLIKHDYAMGMEMLKKFGLEDTKPMKTPISTETKLTKDVEEDPKTSHLEAVKRIFRYVKGTMRLGLWYPKGSDIETIVYADSDHAENYVDRKSTSGICTFIGCCLTSWFSKKQTALAISTTEAEYVRAGKACQQALWMKQALVHYGISFHFTKHQSTSNTTPFPHLLINPHVASVLHAQTPLSPQGDNHPQPPLPPSPSREMLMNDINQLQD
ncbi:retrovirus-related pol polyprotein from transposon TNT 1-94 [Tanacetum coccineum]